MENKTIDMPEVPVILRDIREVRKVFKNIRVG